MKKRTILSLFTLVYLSLYKITNFETGDIGSATLLIYIGVPLFVIISFLLFIQNLYFFIKENFKLSEQNFVLLIINSASIILTYDVYLYFLNPINWGF
jgi:hypothetical protein